MIETIIVLLLINFGWFLRVSPRWYLLFGGILLFFQPLLLAKELVPLTEALTSFAFLIIVSAGILLLARSGSHSAEDLFFRVWESIPVYKHAIVVACALVLFSLPLPWQFSVWWFYLVAALLYHIPARFSAMLTLTLLIGVAGAIIVQQPYAVLFSEFAFYALCAYVVLVVRETGQYRYEAAKARS